MSSEHTPCAFSPRGGGFCKALKDMKSKVATHTGMSLSFVELVATSPAVGLLPAFAPSPRSPSALLHRHMQHHHNSHGPRRSSSTEQTLCSDAETAAAMESLPPQDAHATATIPASHLSLSSCSRMCGLPVTSSASCGYPLLCPCHAASCGIVSEQLMRSSTSSIHLQSASLCNGACEHASSSLSLCNLLCGNQCISACNISASANHPSHANGDHANGDPQCSRFAQYTPQKSIINRVLCSIVTLFFGLISIIKSFYTKGSSAWSHKLKHPLTVNPNAAVKKLCNAQTSEGEANLYSLRVVDLAVGQHRQEASKMTTKGRSTQLLKSKLKSSFKNLSVQVPRKAFAPLHHNTLSSSSPPSSLSSSSSSSSLSSSASPAGCYTFSVKKSRGTPRSPGFARKLTKSWNQRQPLKSAQCSPTTDVGVSPPPLCDMKQHSARTLGNISNSSPIMVVSLVSLPLALCGLFHGKLIACGMVTAWLLIMCIISRLWFELRASSALCI